MVAAAKSTVPPNVSVRRADLLDAGLQPAAYDYISCVSAIHHMDFGAAATALRHRPPPPPSARLSPPAAPSRSSAATGKRPSPTGC
jgi:hypothetical protein